MWGLSKFQASSFAGVGGEWDNGRMRDTTHNTHTKFLNFPHRFERDNEGFFKAIKEKEAICSKLSYSFDEQIHFLGNLSL